MTVIIDYAPTSNPFFSPLCVRPPLLCFRSSQPFVVVVVIVVVLTVVVVILVVSFFSSFSHASLLFALREEIANNALKQLKDTKWITPKGGRTR